MKDSKNLVIGMLCAVVCIMAVAYAAFSTTLNINGTASIESEWGVKFEDPIPACVPSPAQGATGGVTASVNRVSDTVATVTMTFTQPGDSATCTIKVNNVGTLDALLNFNAIAEQKTDTELVKFTLTGTDGTDTKLAAKGSHTITVKGEFLNVVDDKGNSKPVIKSGDGKNDVASLSIIATATQDL